MGNTAGAGRHVPPWTPLEALGSYAVHRAAGLWRWRDVVVPVVALYAAGVVAGGIGLAVVGAIIVLATAVGVLLRPGLVRRSVARCSDRSHARKIHRDWPGICRGLHWYRNLGEREGLLVPQLLGWSDGVNGLDVTLRPLPEQGADQWDKMADALRRFVGGASVEWRESNGTLRIVIGRYALPIVLPWQSEDAYDGQLVLGRRHGGARLTIDLGLTPHVLLAGATGSGKGGTIRAAVAAAMQAGWSVVVLDPKEAGEYFWLMCHGIPFESELSSQVLALEHLEQVRRARQAAIKMAGVDSLVDLPEEVRERWRPVLLVVDEAADLLTVTKGRSDAERSRAARQQRAGELIAELARKGRSAGIHLLVAVQRPDLTQLGEQGGALRNNLTARLALGHLDADGLRMMGISGTDPVVHALDGTRGRGICVGFADDPRPSACQVAWLDQARARAEIGPRWAQGFEFIEPTELPADFVPGEALSATEGGRS